MRFLSGDGWDVKRFVLGDRNKAFWVSRRGDDWKKPIAVSGKSWGWTVKLGQLKKMKSCSPVSPHPIQCEGSRGGDMGFLCDGQEPSVPSQDCKHESYSELRKRKLLINCYSSKVNIPDVITQAPPRPCLCTAQRQAASSLTGQVSVCCWQLQWQAECFGVWKTTFQGFLGYPTSCCPTPPHVPACCSWYPCIFTTPCSPASLLFPMSLPPNAPSTSVSAPTCAPPPSPPPHVPYIPDTPPVGTIRCPPCPQLLHVPTTAHPQPPRCLSPLLHLDGKPPGLATSQWLKSKVANLCSKWVLPG